MNTILKLVKKQYLRILLNFVKGKNEPVTIYEPLAIIGELSPEEEMEFDEYDKALNYYYK
ncbi:MAG TPA: hypothetical protein EYQ42_01590 [Thiotrichaceae bacterium]|nr:hypothetical protein [Thiotrichaceae bacterium]HIM07490.1 hypothetical protein [Gammaproteobacteria bacterium]